MRFPFRFSYEIFLFFFTGIQICQVNLSMLVSTPRETFRKRERERERVRLNVQVAEMFFISLEQIFIQYVDRSNFSRLVGFEGWAYLRIVTRTRRSITNREPPGVKYTRDFIDIQPRTSKNSYAVREEGPRQPYVRENT